MDFSRALEHLKEGGRVARSGWNGKGMWLYLVNGSTFPAESARPPLDRFVEPGTTVKYLPHIDMKTADGSLVPWLASQTDILADDWERV